ncbi:MAG: chemotaxis protein CheA [Deltaproteobacteria bacterium]|nr:chemotaxis protein CheA [Deltaproteobacteria bacterium]
MNNINEKNISMIKKIEEDIDTVGLNDSDAWNNIRSQLEKVIQDISGENTELVNILSLCIEGVRALSDKSVADSLSLVNAISGALTASERYLSDTPDSRLLIGEAGRALGNILNKDSVEYDQPLSLSMLNDAALLLIQLEADDMEGLTGLQQLLNTIIADGSFPESLGQNIVQAAQKIEEVIKTDALDPDLTIAEVGKLIEKAMNEIEDNGRDVTTGSIEERATDDQTGVIEENGDKNVDFVVNRDEPAAEKQVSDYMPENPDIELIGEFIAEGSDLITNAEEALLTLENDPDDMDAVGTVFRAFHTIKGTAAFMELNILSEMAHHAESLLSRVRDREIRYTGGYADLALRSLDMLKELIQAVEQALGGEPLSKPKGYDELMRILENPEQAGISEDFDEAATPRVGDLLVAQGSAERQQVEEAAALYPEKQIGAAIVKSKAASIEDVGRAIRTQKKIQRSKQVVQSSIRVNTDRLDRLINMMGELVIAHSMVAQDEIIINNGHHELLKKIVHTSKIVRELQHMGMSMRMIPLKSTFQKMTRLVRDLSRKVGKNINFVTEGEETEIDRNMVDIVKDPLVHMVRNAVDHGIELPDVRKKTGKPEYGTVRLSAYHSAGNVVVEIKDDGNGLDREKLIAKAIEKEIISDGNLLSDREVFNLIFEPGFSTAKVVSDVSGRGVGMDVVKKNIETLRGQVEIQSEPGKGSVFKMRLPLTLAIIDGMVIRAGRETYVVPIASIVTSLRPNPEDLSTVLNQGEMLSLQGKLIPLFRLDSLFDIRGAEQDPTRAIVMVIEDNESQACLLIDELIGRQQVVIKTLGESMRDIPGISGGAIMPNGRVGLILDVGGLVKFANTRQ